MKTVPFDLSERELNLVKEMADAFLLDFPDHDVEALIERLQNVYDNSFGAK